MLGLVQDGPALRAGAASGILDKTYARRSARGRSAPRNGPLGLTKECNVERYFRDARMQTIPDGTTQIHKLIIGRELTGVSALV